LKYLIDTNVISELRKGTRTNAHVARWYASVDANDLYLSVLVLGEIRKGVEKLGDASQAQAIQNWLDQVRDGFGDRVLAIDKAVADVWGRMTAKRSLPVIDSLLAATAKAHDLTLVSRNVRDIAGTGARLLNPFDGQSIRKS